MGPRGRGRLAHEPERPLLRAAAGEIDERGHRGEGAGQLPEGLEGVSAFGVRDAS